MPHPVYEILEEVYGSYSCLIVISVCMLHWIFKRNNMQIRNLVLWVLGQQLNSFVMYLIKLAQSMVH